MKKYSRELINRYINSEDITIYDIDELENDKDFMMQVISVSGDNNFYNLCSDIVKCDYEFVKYLIIKFKHKIDFVCEVADYFLSHVGKELETTEIYTIMFEITKGNKSLNKKYFLVPLAKYDKEKLIIELYKKSEEDKEILEYFGMGFCYIYAEYKGYEETLNYFAKRMINDIIHENNKSLEDMLHKQFKTKDEVSRTKLNSFYISFIEKYDSSLASYTCVHLNILDEVKEETKRIIDNFEKHNERIEKEKYERAINESYDYILSTDTILGSDCLLYFVARELNILDKVIKYDDSPQALKDIAIEQMDEVFDEENSESFTAYVLNTDINERRIYLNVKRILNGIIFGDGTYQLIEASQDINKKDKGIVLEVKFRKEDK